ncbi:hypothetical protein ZIOFF_063635 [Zingiber officinale]|uniref:NAD-dependent epimerase/dehydratase domain-containing protein n=1 Tax=Zingiber officinale TaxID=94328 RepID=A0A8J5F1U9_ZINOF|nr:hypothetical protein ZIOFF_063635 [Zingiber officinale]
MVTPPLSCSNCSSRDEHVSCTSTCAPKKRELEKMGLDAFIFDANKDKYVITQLLTVPAHSTCQAFPFGTYWVSGIIGASAHNNGKCLSATCPEKRAKIGLSLLYFFDSIVLEYKLTKSYFHGLQFMMLTNLHTLQCATHLLVSIPPLVGIGDPLLYIHRDLQAILEDGNLEWLGYLSSTSVYGDCGGLLVDEDYPPNPKTESAKLRLAAETGWQDLGHELGVSVNVFRLGGIYGPGRCALDTILKGNSLSESQIKRASKVFTSRIHVADVYQALKASFGISSSSKELNYMSDGFCYRLDFFRFDLDRKEKKRPFLEANTVFLAWRREKRTLVLEKRRKNCRHHILILLAGRDPYRQNPSTMYTYVTHDPSSPKTAKPLDLG